MVGCPALPRLRSYLLHLLKALPAEKDSSGLRFACAAEGCHWVAYLQGYLK